MSDEHAMPATATAIMAQWRERQARERYHTDPRFRAIVQSVVHDALERHPQFQNREGHDLGVDMAATLLERIFVEDAELQAQRALADHYRKLLEEGLAFFRVPLISKPPS